MSAGEILVILFGLFLGYWVVSNLLTRTGKERPNPQSPIDPAQSSSADPESGGDADARSWHDVLELRPDASTEEIRAAYRTLIGQYHPDRVATLGKELQLLAERKSKEFNRAYCQAMEERGSPT